jgi:ribonucleoside-diphosphate reductase alpha chain
VTHLSPEAEIGDMSALVETDGVGALGEDETDARNSGSLSLPANALKVLRHRYLRRGETGEVVETPVEMFWRVARSVAAADASYAPGQDPEAIAEQFYAMMSRREFLPNSPTLMNAGTRLGQLSACFVLPVGDSMVSIFSAVKATALIHQSGGGTGFSFSRLRPAGDRVASTGGKASGPISFMQVFDSATDVIKQGGRRRGANMGILRVDHPDILDFISCKEREGSVPNFNISVALSDEFLRSLEKDADYDLVNPRTGASVERIASRLVFERIAEHAWANGEPGVIFLDRMNEFNPTPQLGDYESTNPCGEQVLLPYESCNLGSINLSRMVTTEGAVDWKLMRRIVKLAVRFMDDVITMNRFPLPEIAEATLRTRKIGLGVMGFADLLIILGVPYDSLEAEAIARKIMEAINYWSKEASEELAQTRGSFPAFDESIYAEGRLPIPVPEPRHDGPDTASLKGAPTFDWDALARRIARSGIRNATTTTLAPTGSISIIADTSSGIEPLFALAYLRRHVLGGEELLQVCPAFEEVARNRGFYSEELMRRVAETGDLAGVDGIPRDIETAFVTAHRVAPEWHVRMQAAFQTFTDNAVSKTINFPHGASEEDVQRAYLLAYRLGCKGLTVYRDGSRRSQVLNRGESGSGDRSAQPRQPRARPSITRGSTEKISLGCGRYLYVTINEDEDGLCEVFLQMGKGGGCMASHSEAVGRLISLGLRSGVDPSAITRQLKGIRCPSPSWHNGGSVLSCADGIAKALGRYMDQQARYSEAIAEAGADSGAEEGNGGRTLISGGAMEEEWRVDTSDLADACPECPECGGLLETSEGCLVCRLCGYSQCG